MSEFLSCRPNLEVAELGPAVAFLREVLGFEVEVDEPEMGLVLLRRDAVGLALVRSATPGVNSTTTAYLGVTGVDELHDQCAAQGARIVTGLADHPWGLRDFVVEIPGGHRLALGERALRAGGLVGCHREELGRVGLAELGVLEAGQHSGELADAGLVVQPDHAGAGDRAVA